MPTISRSVSNCWALRDWSIAVLDQLWHVSAFGVSQKTERRHKIVKDTISVYVARGAKSEFAPWADLVIYPCDALATFSVFGFRQFATHSSYFHPLPAYFPAWVCSVRNVHSGCCGTAWSCLPGVLSSSPEALSLGSSSQSAAFMFQRSQAL